MAVRGWRDIDKVRQPSAIVRAQHDAEDRDQRMQIDEWSRKHEQRVPGNLRKFNVVSLILLVLWLAAILWGAR
jgi:hypothetical protein